MKVSIIGSGNVGTVLGRKIKAAGHQLLQVYSRDPDHAKILATELQCSSVNRWREITSEADIYLVAVVDAALPEAAKMIGTKKGLVLHTAGSVSIEVLKTVSLNYGVLYPLQSLKKEKTNYADIPLLVDGNTADDCCMVEDFARSFSNLIQKADDAYRLKLHVAAVFVNNFTNHFFTLAADYCSQEQVNFSLLQPLIEETANRLRDHDPGEVQTGPAARNDQLTINKHLELLHQYPALERIYEFMTERIQRYRSESI
ncbi:MAG: Rossmann-like and DUF2520 domain-containing protein [Chitinophagaceae bacterium]